MPYGTRAPKELLHHRPTLVLCRPFVSAHPAMTLPGVRGSRLLDRRPPHYRCPAVPGLKSPARAILTVPGSSVLSLWDLSLPNFPVRASAADAFTEILLTNVAAARSSSLPGPTVSLGYRRNHTRATGGCLLQPP